MVYNPAYLFLNDFRVFQDSPAKTRPGKACWRRQHPLSILSVERQKAFRWLVVSASAENRHPCHASRRVCWQPVLRSDEKLPFRPLRKCPKNRLLNPGWIFAPDGIIWIFFLVILYDSWDCLQKSLFPLGNSIESSHAIWFLLNPISLI